MDEQTRTAKAQEMEDRVRTYFEGCCEADADKIASCLTPDCLHYFPPGMYDGPWRGARYIADKWVAAVANLGSYWTVDGIVVAPEDDQAVIEWTHFKTKQGTRLRGAEWYFFDPASGLIADIRAYYASPQDPGLKELELGGFDYEGLGYPLAPPPGTRD